MKDNSANSKSLLQQALRLLPQDFCFSETRFHLKEAINNIEKIEKKRANRNKQIMSENAKIENRYVKPAPPTKTPTTTYTKESVYNPQAVLQNINKLIEEEQAKLNKLKMRDDNGPEMDLLG